MSETNLPGADLAQPMVSAGIVLSNARVKRGLSLQDVADRLKLSRKQLEAIENDEYEKLPGTPFARGFVRNYAKLLDLDSAPLMAWLDTRLPAATGGYNSPIHTAHAAAHKAAAHAATATPPASVLFPARTVVTHAPAAEPSTTSPLTPPPVAAAPEKAPEPAKPPVTPPAATPRQGDGKGLRTVAILLLLSGLVVLGFWLLKNGIGSVSAPQLKAPETQIKLPLPPPPLPAVAPASPDVSKPAETSVSPPAAVTPALTPPAASSSVSSASGSAQAAVTDSTRTEAAPRREGEGEVTLTLRDKAWISVVDANKKKLVYGELAANSTKIVTGKPPFVVRIGNAEKVDLSYNGQAVALASKTKGSTATVELK